MNWEKFQPPSTTERGLRIALIFALVAERLTTYYEHGQWLTQGQGAALAADWLSRSKLVFPLAERRQLSDLSDQVARQISGTVSREAGLYIAHELTESLDPNYQSEIGPAIMAECERVFDEAAAL